MSPLDADQEKVNGGMELVSELDRQNHEEHESRRA